MVQTCRTRLLECPTEFPVAAIAGWAAGLMILLVAATVGAAPQTGMIMPVAVAEVTAGRQTFRQFCAPCHGPDGKGHGPVAMFLSSPLSDLTQVRRRNRGEFPLTKLDTMLMLSSRGESTPEHAWGQMPEWGPLLRSIDTSPVLAHVRVAQLLAFLESIQQ